jgi:ribonucleotide reductase alpha subunit
MQIFDMSTHVMKSGGTRRGANMAILPIDHPDIEEFIDVKNDLGLMTNFNISVSLTQQFMQAVERDEEHELAEGSQVSNRRVWGMKMDLGPARLALSCGNITLILAEGCRKCVCGHSEC